MVLGSIHNLPGMEDFSQFDYTFRDLDALLKPYYEELIRLAQWGKCDVITHITYPLRYMAGDYGRKVDLAPYGDLIDELFRTIIQKGLVLEINSSGRGRSWGGPCPTSPCSGGITSWEAGGSASAPTPTGPPIWPRASRSAWRRPAHRLYRNGAFPEPKDHFRPLGGRIEEEFLWIIRKLWNG